MGDRQDWYEDDRGSRGFAFSGGGGGGMPSITKALLIGILVTFGLQVVSFAITKEDPLTELLGLRPSSAPFLVPLVSYMFLHDVGSLFHVLFNCLALYFFGRELEAVLGPKRYLTLFFGAGILGGLAYVIPQLITGDNIPVIGASAGVLGIIVLYAFTYPHRQVIFLIFPVKVWIMASFLVGIDLYSTLMGSGGNVATFAHLGGAAWGALMYYWRGDLLSWTDSAREKIQAARQRREADGRRHQEVEMDRILKKIHDQGLPSLTPQEKKFIDRVSREKRNHN